MAQVGQVSGEIGFQTPKFALSFRQVPDRVVEAAAGAAHGLDAYRILQQALVRYVGFCCLLRPSQLPGRFVPFFPEQPHPLLEAIQPGDGILREVQIQRHIPKPRLTVRQRHPVFPPVEQVLDFSPLGAETVQLGIGVLQFRIYIQLAGGKVSITTGVAFDRPQLRVNRLKFLHQVGHPLGVAPAQVDLSLVVAEGLPQRRQPGRALSGAVYGAAGIVQRAGHLQFVQAEGEYVAEQVGGGVAGQPLQQHVGVGCRAAGGGDAQAAPRSGVPLHAVDCPGAVRHRDAPAVPTPGQRGIMGVEPRREAQQYRPDEGQRGALARLVGAVEHRDRPGERPDGALMEMAEAVQVQLFDPHPSSSSFTSEDRHSSSAAASSSSSSPSDGI